MLIAAIQPVGEGLAEGAWADAELAALADVLAGVDLAADFLQAVAIERASMNSRFDLLAKSGSAERRKLLGQPVSRVTGFITGGFASEAKIRRSQLAMNREIDKVLAWHADGRPAGQRHVPILKPDAVSRYAASDNLRRVEEAYLQTLSQLAQTRLALALERFRRTHGSFPARLDELIPMFTGALPADPWTGTPMQYSRVKDGSFTLYSAGADGIDGRGRLIPTRGIFTQKDAIWPFAPRARDGVRE